MDKLQFQIDYKKLQECLEELGIERVAHMVIVLSQVVMELTDHACKDKTPEWFVDTFRDIESMKFYSIMIKEFHTLGIFKEVKDAETKSNS